MSRSKPASFARSSRRGAKPPEQWTGSVALMLVDNRPLQREAWAEFHTARKRVEKVTRDLHRHEQTDQPEYDAWIYRTFPALISELRQLHEEVANKSGQVQAVQMMATFSGRSHKRLWRELQKGEIDPASFFAEYGTAFGDEEDEDDLFDEDEDDPERLLEREAAKAGRRARQEEDEDEPDETSSRGGKGAGMGARPARKHSRVTQLAKDIYRRLVQRLHPDRGGDWTEARMRLWHEVQKAWEAGDADWLARLEVEWETAADLLGPDSPVGRLKRAIRELDAARRDTERKLRYYRRAPAWRFTLSEDKREGLRRRTEFDFRADREYLQQQLAYLNATIAAWEKPVGLAAARELKDTRGKNTRVSR